MAVAVLNRAQQALAQGNLAACVEPYVVITNFSLHNSETNPHPALHQVKPLRQVVCLWSGHHCLWNSYGCCLAACLAQLCQCVLPNSMKPLKMLGQALYELRPSFRVASAKAGCLIQWRLRLPVACGQLTSHKFSDLGPWWPVQASGYCVNKMETTCHLAILKHIIQFLVESQWVFAEV